MHIIESKVIRHTLLWIQIVWIVIIKGTKKRKQNIEKNIIKITKKEKKQYNKEYHRLIPKKGGLQKSLKRVGGEGNIAHQLYMVFRTLEWGLRPP